MALVIGNERVLGSGHPHVQRFGVVCQDMIQEFQRTLAANVKPAHVRNIEKPGALAGGKVFLDDPGRIEDRHIPPPEFNQLGPESPMLFIENRLPQCIHQLSPVFDDESGVVSLAS